MVVITSKWLKISGYLSAYIQNSVISHLARTDLSHAIDEEDLRHDALGKKSKPDEQEKKRFRKCPMELKREVQTSANQGALEIISSAGGLQAKTISLKRSP